MVPVLSVQETGNNPSEDSMSSQTLSAIVEPGQDVNAPVYRPFFIDVLDPAESQVEHASSSSSSPGDKSTFKPTILSSSSDRPISIVPDTNWLEDAVTSVQPFIKSLQPIISGLIDGAIQMVQNLPKPRDPPAFEADPDDASILDTKGMTERIMKKTPVEGQATGAGGSSTWDAFQRVEKNWKALKESKPQRLADVVEFVTDDGAKGNPRCWQKLNEQRGKELDYDVVVCGGTLGIFFATALRLKGQRVAVLEAGKLRGREQEWNLSMDELQELVKLGVLTQEDVDAAVTTEFPGCRSGFKNKETTPLVGGYFDNGIGYECYTPNVLNLGVTPSILLERAADRFRALGGVIMEETRLAGVAISEARGAAVDLGAEAEPVTAHLVLDCMGNGSPISRQQRRGVKPDGVCAVVGSCASGFDNETNILGDIIYTNSMIQDKGENGMLQYFWEAFPVGIGRNGKEPGSSDTKTTYMFTYMDANEKRPSLETLMEDYWRMLPKYQPSITNPETDLDVKRVLFAYFPTYRSSPLKPRWSRILSVGDASGIQSPLSFGGFGALTRHLDRISTAVSEALDKNLLDKDDLAEINAYLPNLSAAWMFQKAMSVRVGQKVDPTFMNRLLATNFEVMNSMGQRTIKPFLQDVVRFDGLVGSLARSFVADPGFMPDIVNHVGLPTLVEWLAHVTMMGTYSVLDTVASPLVRAALATMEEDDERTKFQWKRRMEAWRYGSGNDYQLPKDN
jgi:flavin-dependent dehydrogenase